MAENSVKWVLYALEEIAKHTDAEDGSLWRASYTPADKSAKAQLRSWMAQKGLEDYEDAVGNVFGRLGGTVPGTVLVASHIDSVRCAGKYDGMLGVLCAIEALAQLKAELGLPRRSVEAAGLLEEEGSRFPSGYLGNRALTGRLNPGDLEERDENGVSIAEAMEAAGYDPGRAAQAQRDDLVRFIELHVEQGPCLEQMGIPVGIVTGIVGLAAGEVVFNGRQNHAGTTPMALRSDPMTAAAHFIAEMEARVKSAGNATFTVGRLQLLPGSGNVIPGQVRVTYDLRSADETHLLALLEQMKACAGKWAQSCGLQCAVETVALEKPALMDPGGMDSLDAIARKLGIPAVRLPSGAGHDAQAFAGQVPTVMLFVPSAHGVSHSPEEYTRPEDIEKGFAIVKEYLRTLCWD